MAIPKELVDYRDIFSVVKTKKGYYIVLEGSKQSQWVCLVQEDRTRIHGEIKSETYPISEVAQFVGIESETRVEQFLFALENCSNLYDYCKNQDFSEFSPRKTYFAFLDLLGFKQLIQKAEKNESLYLKKIAMYLKSVEEIEKTKSSTVIIKTKVISDSILVWVDVPDWEGLHHLCLAVAKIQYELTKHDLWLRGAISNGKLFQHPNDTLIVGSALINAYLLEENKAKFPRVIIDPKIFSDFTSRSSFLSSINSFGEMEASWRTNLIYKPSHANKFIEEDYWFIDYISQYFLQQDEIETDYLLDNVQRQVASAHYEKFLWVANYLKEHFMKKYLQTHRYTSINYDAPTYDSQFERLRYL